MAPGLQGIERQLDLCFTTGNEALARNLIRKRLEIAQRSRGVARSQAETGAQRDQLARKIAEHKQQLAAVVQQLKLWTENCPIRPGMASCSPLFQDGGVITDDEVEVAFLEEKQRRRSRATSNLA